MRFGRMIRALSAAVLLAVLLCALCCAEEAGPFPSLVEEIRKSMHLETRAWMSEYPLPYAWCEYADDPAALPAWAVVEAEGDPALLVGDAGDPEGVFRYMFAARDGETTLVRDAAEGPWRLLADGTVAGPGDAGMAGEPQPIAWTRFFESRKAVVAAEKRGYAADRRTPEKNGEFLGNLETGTVIVVDGVTDGFAWFRFRAVRDGVSAASDGYLPEEDIRYLEETVPYGYGILSKKGRTEGNAVINVRFRPTTQSRRIAGIPVGTDVELYGHENGWYEIEWNRMHGYVKEEFLTEYED